MKVYQNVYLTCMTDTLFYCPAKRETISDTPRRMVYIFYHKHIFYVFH